MAKDTGSVRIQKSGPKDLIDWQIRIYEMIHSFHKPEDIRRESETCYSYKFMHGPMCTDTRAIRKTVKLALWDLVQPAKECDMKVRSDYFNYVLDLVPEFMDKDQVSQALRPILFDELTPVGYTHGDLICANTVQHGNRIILIDPVNTHGLFCQEIEEAKLMTSLEGWERIRYGLKYDYSHMGIEPRNVHYALLLSHYIRMLRYQSGAIETWAIARCNELMTNERKKTYFIDIDGCLVIHYNSTHSDQITKPLELTKGALEFLDDLERQGHMIILCSARKECCREQFQNALRYAGIFWDQLILGCTNGPRIIINDKKIVPGTLDTCYAVNVIRNKGLELWQQ